MCEPGQGTSDSLRPGLCQRPSLLYVDAYPQYFICFADPLRILSPSRSTLILYSFQPNTQRNSIEPSDRSIIADRVEPINPEKVICTIVAHSKHSFLT